MIAAYQNGNITDLSPLFVQYQPLLRILTSRLNCPCEMKEDLIQSGFIGLLLAVKGFKSEYNTRFITYAVPWILGEMKKALRMYFSQMHTLPLQYAEDERKIDLTERLCCEGECDLSKIELRIAIGMLSDEERRLVCLRYFKDKTQIETARILHKSQAQISRLEQRALNDLKKSLT